MAPPCGALAPGAKRDHQLFSAPAVIFRPVDVLNQSSPAFAAILSALAPDKAARLLDAVSADRAVHELLVSVPESGENPIAGLSNFPLRKSEAVVPFAGRRMKHSRRGAKGGERSGKRIFSAWGSL